MQIVNNTSGIPPTAAQRYALTVEHRNGERYVYYGKTKEIARHNYLCRYPYYIRDVVRQEWDIVDD